MGFQLKLTSHIAEFSSSPAAGGSCANSRNRCRGRAPLRSVVVCCGLSSHAAIKLARRHGCVRLSAADASSSVSLLVVGCYQVAVCCHWLTGGSWFLIKHWSRLDGFTFLAALSIACP